MPEVSQAFIDRLTIRERVDAYIDALNHRDWTAFAEFLTEDMIWSASEPFGHRVEGRDAMLARMTDRQQTDYEFVFQMGHGLVIRELTATTARTCHTLHIISNHFTAIGFYYDALVKESDGAWRFRRRDYRVTYYDDSPLQGRIFRRLPDPQAAGLPTYP